MITILGIYNEIYDDIYIIICGTNHRGGPTLCAVYSMTTPGGDGTQDAVQAAERAAQQYVGQSPVLATTNLRFVPTRNFSGKEEDWDLFQYKFKAYMNLARIKFAGIFKLVQ